MTARVMPKWDQMTRDELEGDAAKLWNAGNAVCETLDSNDRNSDSAYRQVISELYEALK